MARKHYAKVILGDTNTLTFAKYGRNLAAMAGEGLDVGVTQVGVHEALVRPHIVQHLLDRNPGRSVEDLLVAQAGADRVEEIEPADAFVLYRQRIQEDLQPKDLPPVPAAAGGRNWHLDAVNVQPAWNAVGGPDAIQWGSIRVGQIDTGYTRHHAFGHGAAGNSWIPAADCRSFEPFPSGLPGVDPMPFGALSKGHGSRIGSVISGWAPLPGGAVYRGIAPKVPHVMVRITDSVAINTRQAEFVQAVDYLVNIAKVNVINISLGMYPPVASPAVKAVMANARNNGVIVVCAAGNEVDDVVVPAALETAIAVAGTTWQSLPWHGSAFGDAVDFSAPATNIFRADPQRTGVGAQFAGGGDGTSYATAITTGAAALWLLRWGPQISVKYGPGSARVEAFRQAAMATSRKPPGWQPKPFGAGILDIGRLCTDAQAALPNVPMVAVPANFVAGAGVPI
jgi:hypothetical protein